MYVTDQPNPKVECIITPKVGILTSSLDSVTPEAVRPYPKTKPQQNKAKRKQDHSRILTSSPEKRLIEAKIIAGPTKKNLKSSPLVKKTPKQKNIIVDTSSSVEDNKFSLHDESEDEVIISDEQEDITPLLDDLKPNDFVLVQFATKGQDSQSPLATWRLSF